MKLKSPWLSPDSFPNLTSVGCHIVIQNNQHLVDLGNVFPLLTDMVNSSTYGPRSCQNGAMRIVSNIRLASLNSSFASIRHGEAPPASPPFPSVYQLVDSP